MEQTLVALAQQGDHEAFDELALGITDRLYSVAFRILRNPPAAEDATQQALVAIWRHLPRLRELDKFEAWAYRLLVRACYAEHRRGRRETPSERLVDGASDDPFLTVQLRDELERGFARITAEQRAVLVLQHYRGLSHEEMAEVLGIPVGTVRSRLHAARTRMRGALEAEARRTAARGLSA